MVQTTHVGGCFTRHTLLLAAHQHLHPSPFRGPCTHPAPFQSFMANLEQNMKSFCPVLTLFFFLPFSSSSTPHQPWSSKPNYVPSRNPVSTLDTAPCAADVTGKRSGWAPKKPNLCTNKEKSHKSWPGHKPGDVFTRKTWTTDKRKK